MQRSLSWSTQFKENGMYLRKTKGTNKMFVKHCLGILKDLIMCLNHIWMWSWFLWWKIKKIFIHEEKKNGWRPQKTINCLYAQTREEISNQTEQNASFWYRERTLFQSWIVTPNATREDIWKVVIICELLYINTHVNIQN